VQEVAPADGLYEPAAHGVGAALPAGQVAPAGQITGGSAVAFAAQKYDVGHCTCDALPAGQ